MEDRWFKIRIGIIAIPFIGMLFVPPAPLDDAHLGFLVGAVVIGLAMAPLAVVFVVGIQALNPFNEGKWTRPTHHSIPLHRRNPLCLFHFGANLIGAMGLGYLVSSIWNGWATAVHAVLIVVGAFLILVGVYLSMRLFASRMAES